MKAVVHDRYGPPDVLRLEEVERPVPKDDEVLIKIRATTVNRTDSGLRSAEYFISRFVTGLRRPKRRILGMELAGEVEAVGAGVSQFEAGDEVIGVTDFGAHAEFVCMRRRPRWRASGACTSTRCPTATTTPLRSPGYGRATRNWTPRSGAP
jgi:NADPH:quinone reductase-like Zn-dependent oxidoreductase